MLINDSEEDKRSSSFGLFPRLNTEIDLHKELTLKTKKEKLLSFFKS